MSCRRSFLDVLAFGGGRCSAGRFCAGPDVASLRRVRRFFCLYFIDIPMLDFPTDDDLAEVERLQCEARFAYFLRCAWPHFEPALPFVGSAAIDALCDELQAVVEGKCRRLLIAMPPRHSKSSILSVALNAWVWARPPMVDANGEPVLTCGPGTKFLTLSHAESLTNRDAVKTRTLLESVWYQKHWGDRWAFQSDQNQKTRYLTDRGGQRLTGTSTSVTGEGGNIVIIDDSISAENANSPTEREKVVRVFSEALRSRLDNDRAAMIVCGQRLHVADLAGDILQKGGYRFVCLPVRFEPDHPHVYERDIREPGELLSPRRFGEEAIAETEREMGPYAFDAQFQQRPTNRQGAFFEAAKLRIEESLPVDSSGASIPIVRRIRAWDLATTKGSGSAASAGRSWTAGVLMAMTADRRFWILDVQRFQEGWHEVERRIRRQAELDGYGTTICLPQDPGSAGRVVHDSLFRLLAGYDIETDKQGASKEARALPLAGQIGAGNVAIVKGVDDVPPEWVDPFVREVESFPGRTKDQVDAAASAFNCLARPSQRAMIVGGGVVAGDGAAYQPEAFGVFGGGR